MGFQMDELHVTARFPAISAANLEAFKALIAEAIVKARSEPGNVQYEWFFNDDRTKCFVREAYADSNTVLSRGVRPDRNDHRTHRRADPLFELNPKPGQV